MAHTPQMMLRSMYILYKTCDAITEIPIATQLNLQGLDCVDWRVQVRPGHFHGAD